MYAHSRTTHRSCLRARPSRVDAVLRAQRAPGQRSHGVVQRTMELAVQFRNFSQAGACHIRSARLATSWRQRRAKTRAPPVRRCCAPSRADRSPQVGLGRKQSAGFGGGCGAAHAPIFDERPRTQRLARSGTLAAQNPARAQPTLREILLATGGLARASLAQSLRNRCGFAQSRCAILAQALRNGLHIAARIAQLRKVCAVAQACATVKQTRERRVCD